MGNGPSVIVLVQVMISYFTSLELLVKGRVDNGPRVILLVWVIVSNGSRVKVLV